MFIIIEEDLNGKIHKRSFLYYGIQTGTLRTGKKYVSQVLSEALIVHVETTFYSVDNGAKMSLAWSGKGK